MNFCDCKKPLFDNHSGRLTESGRRAYGRLIKFTEALGELKLIDSVDLCKKFDQIVDAIRIRNGYWDFNNNQVSEIAKVTLGKKLYVYDSWNGSSMTITIEDIKIQQDTIQFIGQNAWGNKSGIFVDLTLIEELLATGQAEKSLVLEGCSCKTVWKLSSNT